MVSNLKVAAVAVFNGVTGTQNKMNNCCCCSLLDPQKQLGEVERLLQLETIAAAKAFANRQAQEVLENVSAATVSRCLFVSAV